MPNTCPNCQRPVRTGAKFCGFCGTRLTPVNASPGTPPSTAGSAVPDAGPSGGYCPYCHSPLRLGVKFCSSCGKPLPGPASAQPPTPAPPASPPQTPATAQKPTRERPKRKRSKGRLIIYLLLILVLCLVIIVPLIVIAWPSISPYLDRFLPPGNVTATPTSTSEPTSTPTEKPAPLPTQTPTAKVTEFLTPTATISPTATLTPEPSATLTPIPTISPLLADQFTLPLTTTWNTWGIPIPVIITSPVSALSLTGSANSSEAGVTGLNPFTLNPGLVISFTATIISPTGTLYLDWDPGLEIRLSGAAPGPLHLTVEPSQVSFNLVQAINGQVATCSSIYSTGGTHSYLIQFDADGMIKLYQDHNIVCSLPGPIEGSVDTQGRLSFSGNGTVNKVLVYIQP
jgi:hypothetical protein